MPTNKPEVVLPEPYIKGEFGKSDLYNADQLRAYGQARYEAGRAAQAKHHQQQVGHLPSDAVAWLDMGKGEAQLMFGKRDASNRANKRQLAMLFEKVNPGCHPLYLHPQSDDTLTRPASGEYDRELIAEMLDDLLRAEAAAEERGTTEGRSYFNRDAIAEQARLLRAADNRDAAGVHAATVNGGAERHFYPAGPVGGWCTRCGCGNDSANFAHLSSCADSPVPAPSIGDFVMVPREPTQAMVDAGMDADTNCIDVYAAMLSAAPQQHGQEVVYQCPKCGTGMEVDPTAKPSSTKPQQPAEAVAAVKLLNEVERNSLNDLLSNLEHEAGDVEDLPPSIEDDDAYWPYHQWHAITKLLGRDNARGITTPAIDIGKLRELVAKWRSEADRWRKDGLPDALAAAHNAEAYIRGLTAIIGDGGEKGNG